MTEGWVLAVFGALYGSLQLLIAWLINRILIRVDALGERLEKAVTKAECASDMCKHEEEIRNLWENTRRNAEQIAIIKATNRQIKE